MNPKQTARDECVFCKAKHRPKHKFMCLKTNSILENGENNESQTSD